MSNIEPTAEPQRRQYTVKYQRGGNPAIQLEPGVNDDLLPGRKWPLASPSCRPTRSWRSWASASATTPSSSPPCCPATAKSTARRSHSKRRPPASSCRRSASMSLIDRPEPLRRPRRATHGAETGPANGPVADLSREGPRPGRLPVPGLSHGRVRLPPGRRTEGGRMPGIHRPGRATGRGTKVHAGPMRFARGGGQRTWP